MTHVTCDMSFCTIHMIWNREPRSGHFYKDESEWKRTDGWFQVLQDNFYQPQFSNLYSFIRSQRRVDS